MGGLEDGELGLWRCMQVAPSGGMGGRLTAVAAGAAMVANE